MEVPVRDQKISRYSMEEEKKLHNGISSEESEDSGGKELSLTHDADSDPPALKPDKYKIPVDNKVTISIGGCSVKFPAHSATEPTPLCLGYKRDAAAPPDGYVYASSTLTCTPPFQGRQDQKITLPTWCRGNHVDAGIFQKDTKGKWEEIDKLLLTCDGHLVLYRRTLNNVTAFVPTERLKDVQFSVSCVLFNNPDSKFAMGFCLKDEAVENVFLHKLKKESYCRTFKSLDDVTVTLGDEIHYRITPGQQMQNTKFFIDEEFITSHAGHVSYCELEKCSSKPSYIVEHMRQDGDGDLEAVSRSGFSRKISEKEVPDAGKSGVGVVFQGPVDVGNVFRRAHDIKIDPEVGLALQSKPFWEDHIEDVVLYEEKAKKKSREKLKKSKVAGSGAAVIFNKPVKAQIVIGEAKSVFVDQRRNGANGKSQPFMARRKMRLEKQTKAQKPWGKEHKAGVQEERPLTENIRAPTQNYAQHFVEDVNLKASLSSHDKGFQRVEHMLVYAVPDFNKAVPFMDEKVTKPDGGSKTVDSNFVVRTLDLPGPGGSDIETKPEPTEGDMSESDPTSTEGDCHLTAKFDSSGESNAELLGLNKKLKDIEYLYELVEFMDEHRAKKYPLKLRITNMRLDKRAAEKIVGIINGREVTELGLICCGLSVNILKFLKEKMSQQSIRVKTLSITQPGKIAELSDGIAELMKSCEVQQLYLMCNCMKETDLSHLKTSLQKLKVVVLDVSYNKGISLKALAEIVVNSQVTTLKAAQCEISDDGLQAFRDVLKGKDVKVQHLDLSNNWNITTGGFQVLAEIVKTAGVQNLRLSDVDLTEEEVKGFCPDVYWMPKERLEITKLDVSYNKDMDEADLAELGKAVDYWNVEDICLAGCDLNGKLLQSFGNNVSKKIKVLGIADNMKIGNGMSEVAEIVKKHSVEGLDMSSCNLTASQLRQFMTSLSTDTKLKELDLSIHNQVPTKALIESICELLPQIKEKLHLHSRKLAEDCKTMLQRELDKLSTKGIQIMLNEGQVMRQQTG